MAFLKKATLNIKSVYAADNNGKFQWRDFVKQANETPSNDRTKFLPPEAYNFDTKNFLFLTARAISGMEKHGYNGNYDAFPWEEIKKALPTYPGVGFYIEHKEDSEADAKGIVLDAIPNEEENFVVCLCAIDKNEYPEFVQQILDGTYNQVSMSCLASTCICSKCGNVATSFDNLCEHMNPNNPITYCKGKVDENGNVVYEINKDLCFTGLSAVEVPADKDAFVFDIKASKKKENKLKEEFAKYTQLKQAGKMKEFKMACEEQFKSMSNVDLLNKLQTSANTILNQVMGNEESANIITGPLQNILKQLMELQIGLTILDLQKLNNSAIEPTKEEGGQEPLTMIEDAAENSEEYQEEVNLDKEVNSMLKQAEEDYSKVSKEDFIKEMVRDYNKLTYSDLQGIVMAYCSDNDYNYDEDELLEEINNKANENKEVNLDKEIDSYLDSDNYSYTPFSSTAKVKKQAGCWAFPETTFEANKLRELMLNPMLATDSTKDLLYGLFGDDNLFDRIDKLQANTSKEDIRPIIISRLKDYLPEIKDNKTKAILEDIVGEKIPYAYAKEDKESKELEELINKLY